MSAEIGGNALLEILGRALSPITSALETVRTRPSPTAWHDAIAEEKAFTPETYKNKIVYEYKNPLKATIAIRRLGIIFNTKPTATWQPVVEIVIDDGIVFRSVGNAFKDTDLTLELDGGRPLPRDKSLKVYVWNAASSTTSKTITAFVQAGEP